MPPSPGRCRCRGWTFPIASPLTRRMSSGAVHQSKKKPGAGELLMNRLLLTIPDPRAWRARGAEIWRRCVVMTQFVQLSGCRWPWVGGLRVRARPPAAPRRFWSNMLSVRRQTVGRFSAYMPCALAVSSLYGVGKLVAADVTSVIGPKSVGVAWRTTPSVKLRAGHPSITSCRSCPGHKSRKLPWFGNSGWLDRGVCSVKSIPIRFEIYLDQRTA